MATNLKNSAFKVKVGKSADVSKSLPEVGAIVINELDDFLYIATRYGWGRGTDASQKQINLFLDYDGVTQFSLMWKMPSTSSIIIDLGDGAGPQTLPGQDGTMIVTNSTYSTQGQYYITIGGDIEDFTWFRLLNQPNLYGDVTRCETMKDLEIFTLNNVSVSCDISGFGGMTSMANFAVQDCPNVFGEASAVDLAASGILTLRDSGKITMNATKDWSNAMAIILTDNLFTREQTNNVIRSVKDASDATVGLDGNELPTEAVKADFLEALDDEVIFTMKGKIPWLDYGPEQYTSANAVSITNEADATTDWTPTNLGSPNVFESQAGNRRKGLYAFFVNANPNPSSGWKIEQTLTLVDQEITALKFDFKHTGIGDHVGFRMWGKNSLGWTMWPDRTEWASLYAYFKNRSTSTTFFLGEINQTNSGSFYLDAVSIKKMLP